MVESLSYPSEKSGLPAGSLVHVGDVLETTTSIHLIHYNKENITSRPLQHLDDLLSYKESDGITWVIVEGLSNTAVVEQIGRIFGIHQLVLEDILNTHQRPKFEEYDDYLYIVLKCLLPERGLFSVNEEQVSLLVLKNFVFSFKEKRDTLFNSIQQHIHAGKSRFRGLGSDYLAYAILDTIVDQNFTLMDALDDAITSLEENILTADPTQENLYTIQKLKRDVITIRRHISPVRELMAGMLRSDSELIHEKTYLYLRDVSDHSIRIIELIESYRDILSGLLDIHISSASNKMNEIMKVLTVFASIFIPLTFLAGIYGMNFDYMPELHWKWSYPILWIAFISVPIISLTYFRRKKWL